MRHLLCVVGMQGALALGVWGQTPSGITLEKLLAEMTDRSALARVADPPYTCKQFSSYDRASKTPEDPATWFANDDVGKFLREEDVQGVEAGKPRHEYVMADMDGPGTVVRVWSANPKGTLRVYLDGSAAPALEAPAAELLGGKAKVGEVAVGEPWAGEHSKGYNLYLPIPYAAHCKVTCDEGGFYYHVNYRTYASGTAVESFSREALSRSAGPLAAAATKLTAPRRPGPARVPPVVPALGPGESRDLALGNGTASAAVSTLYVGLKASDLPTALRKVVISAEFDGEQTIWAPLGAFFIAGKPHADWYRATDGASLLRCDWFMPYEKGVKFTFTNLGTEPVELWSVAGVSNFAWDERSMHFHARWREEYPLHVAGGRGTTDWNFVQVQGQGTYVGETLTVMNPVEEWWGEGDEKVYVDGEGFPSHFGTGTEDYFGYAWCSNVPFRHPFHAQVRCDGQEHGNNWGWTTVTRVRSLDAIPFTKGLKFDMELWHWKECDVLYGVTTYFYARPGATDNRPAAPEQVAKPWPIPPPLPPPFAVKGAVECEGMQVAARSPAVETERQDMRAFKKGAWSGEAQLWVKARGPGAFVDLKIPAPDAAARKLTLYATRSWDYGVVRFSVNGQKALETDLFSGEHGKCEPTGPLELGTFTPVDGQFVLRAEVVGGNEKAEGTRAFFGLDCVVLGPAGPG